MKLYVFSWPDDSVTLILAPTLAAAMREADAFGDASAANITACGPITTLAIDSHDYSESLLEAVLAGDEDRDSLAERVVDLFSREDVTGDAPSSPL